MGPANRRAAPAAARRPAIPWTRRTALAAACATGAALAGAGSAAGQEPGPFRPLEPLLLVEASQGLVTDRGRPLPYTLSLRVTPSVVLDEHGRGRVGLASALTYRNPGWEALAGLRATYRVLTFVLPEAGLDLGAEGLLGTDGGDEVAAVLTVDLDGLLRLGARAARDVSRGRYLLEASLGTDLLTLLPHLTGRRVEDPF